MTMVFSQARGLPTLVRITGSETLNICLLPFTGYKHKTVITNKLIEKGVSANFSKSAILHRYTLDFSQVIFWGILCRVETASPVIQCMKDKTSIISFLMSLTEYLILGPNVGLTSWSNIQK